MATDHRGHNFYSEIIADQNFVAMLDGMAYRWFDHQDLNPLQTKYYIVYIPESPEIWFYGRSFSGRGSDISLEVFANPTLTSLGTLMDNRVFNRNSEYPTANLAKIYEDPTFTAEGTESDYDETSGALGQGNKGSSGSDSSQDFPRIMPVDTYLLVKVTNLSDQNVGHYTYKLFWNEIPRG